MNKEEKSQYYKRWREKHREQHRRSHGQRNKVYRAKYPERRKAEQAVERAIKKGTLIRQPCEVCGDPRAQAHHDDYSKPLIIRWLCDKHHKNLHRRKKEELITLPHRKHTPIQ